MRTPPPLPCLQPGAQVGLLGRWPVRRAVGAGMGRGGRCQCMLAPLVFTACSPARCKLQQFSLSLLGCYWLLASYRPGYRTGPDQPGGACALRPRPLQQRALEGCDACFNMPTDPACSSEPFCALGACLRRQSFFMRPQPVIALAPHRPHLSPTLEAHVTPHCSLLFTDQGAHIGRHARPCVSLSVGR